MTALCVLAFLPQFVEVERGHVATQIAGLGVLFTALGFVTDGCYALAAGTAGRLIRECRGYARFERLFSGTVFIGLGLNAAFTGSRHTADRETVYRGGLHPVCQPAGPGRGRRRWGASLGRRGHASGAT